MQTPTQRGADTTLQQLRSAVEIEKTELASLYCDEDLGILAPYSLKDSIAGSPSG